MLTEQREAAKKAMFALVGAPVVAGRFIADTSTKMVKEARSQFDEFATEGEKVTKQMRDTNVMEEISDRVEEISDRMDLEQIQGRVDKLRDRLEDVLTDWRESFAANRPETTVITKPVAKKAPAKKAPVKKAAAKKAPAKKAPVKKAVAKKAPAKKAPVKKAAAKKAPARASK